MTEAPRHLHVVRDGADAPALQLPPGDDFATQEPKDPDVLEGQVVLRPAAPGYQIPARIQPSERTKQIARTTAVTAATIGQGWKSWLIRAWDGLTLGVYRRQIRAAEAAGDQVLLAEWVERKQKAAAQRNARLLDLPILVLGLAKLTAFALAGLVVFVLLLSIAVWASGVGEFLTVIRGIGTVIRWILTAVSWVWMPLLISVPFAVLFAAWREGRRVGTPLWLVGEDEDGPEGRDVIPDEGAILNALRNMGISQLNAAFKAGWRPRFPLGTGRDGKGYRTQLELPAGVTVEMINKRKQILAHNLVRLPVEVWPTEPKDKPGVLDLWVADQGSLTGPVDPWPLLNEGTADYFKGVPVAVDIRGTSVIGRLSEANYALAGMMGSGKSTVIITALLGALLDPLVDADVFVMATNADYDPMKPRLRTLLTGSGDDVVEACMDRLRKAYADLDVRGKALKEHGERAVNRQLAEKDARLRPRIIVIDECQALFMHPELGEEAVSLTVRLISAARKYAYTLIFATPEPSSDSLPRKVMAVISNKACFAIGDQQSNDAVLGTGSYTAGISAVSLEPKTDEGNGDVGTFMARGFRPKPGLLRGYYVSQKEAYLVVERAVKLREQAGIGTAKAVVEEERDLLEDLAQVLGEEIVYAADLPALLRERAPRWMPYRSMSGKSLREDLADLGVKVPSTGNRYPVSPALIQEALARRAGEEEDEG